MLIKSALISVIAIFIVFVTSPSYSGDIISCDSFESCPDGSVPLTNALLALEARIEELEALLVANTAADDSAHHTKYTDKESVAAVGSHSPNYSALLAGVSRGTDPNTKQDTLTFTKMNVQIVNGSSTTDGAVTGNGNLIIGYNETGNSRGDDRSGSHMLIAGSKNSYSSFGGIVVGSNNTTSGNYSSVSGGSNSSASGNYSSVSGG
jgi:hypothetical protein